MERLLQISVYFLKNTHSGIHAESEIEDLSVPSCKSIGTGFLLENKSQWRSIIGRRICVCVCVCGGGGGGRKIGRAVCRERV